MAETSVRFSRQLDRIRRRKPLLCCATLSIVLFFSGLLVCILMKPSAEGLSDIVNLKDVCINYHNGSGKASVDISTLQLYETLPMPKRGGGNKDWSKIDMDYNISRRRDEPLRVILFPFSHADPGWYKTAAENFFQDSFHIITNAVVKLHQHKKLTFIWAESIYLSWWWDAANSTMRDLLKALLKEGRFEIVGGGWVMPDEANPTGYALVDQMLEGHLFLRQKLGFAPKTSFNIDPFGYSTIAARIRSEAGVKRSIINRIHHKIKEYLDTNSDAEFLWRQSWDVEGVSDLRVYVHPLQTYTIKYSCGPMFWICSQYDFWKPNSAKPIDARNVRDQAIQLLDQLRKKSLWFKHNVVLVMLGNDFRFIQANQFDRQFQNWNMLFDYFNKHSDELRVTAKFGTPSEYFDAADEALRKGSQLKTLSGDFFTYNDYDNSHWSGYFTTRMAWKVLGRRLESLLRAADVFFTLSADNRDYPSSRRERKVREFQDLRGAHQELALFQHHDDVTGTSKAHNAADIARRLCHGFAQAQRALIGAISSLMEFRTGRGTEVDNALRVTLNADLSEVGVTPITVDLRGYAPSVTLVVLSNALPFKRREIIRLRVNRRDVEVKARKIVRHQIDPVWTNLGNLELNIYELVFEVKMEPFEIKRLFVRSVQASSANAASWFPVSNVTVFGHRNHALESRAFFVTVAHWPPKSRFTISNGCLAAEFEISAGLLRRMMMAGPAGRTDSKARLGFWWYPSVKGGAYIFKPSGRAKEGSSPSEAAIVSGPVVTTVRVVFPMIEHVVEMVGGQRLDGYPAKSIWFSEILPPLSRQACADSELLQSLRITNRVLLKGKSSNLEPVMRIDTNIDSGVDFFTDSNGLAMMQRRRLTKLPIPGNFYPMPTAAFIEDRPGGEGRRRLTLLSAQPQGASSQGSGSLEAMQDRRLLRDDGRGMGEGVLDNQLSTLRYALILEERGRTEAAAPAIPLLSLGAHNLRRRLNSPVEIFYSAERTMVEAAASAAAAEAAQVEQTSFWTSSRPAIPFPCDVDLVSLRPLPNLASGSNDSSKALPGNETVFTLSRPSFDSRYPPNDEVSKFCGATNGSALSLGHHFGAGVEVRNARKASLTLLYDGAALGDDPVVELKPEALISVVAEVRRRRGGP